MTERIFFPDDIDRINAKYFKVLREQNEILADPSYWYQNNSDAVEKYGYKKIGAYRSDYNMGIREEKPIILDGLSHWDLCTYDYNDLTLCSTATAASFIVLSHIKNQGKIKKIYFETPCYFASLRQSEYLGFEVNRLPSYYDSNFQVDFSVLPKDPKIIWLTQPRYGIGQNNSLSTIESLLSNMGKRDFLIIDEAAENMYPAHLREFNFKRDPRIIKIRNPFKGMGLNGPRISSIIHGPKHRASIQIALEVIQGAMDALALSFTTQVMLDIQRYKSMMQIANSQVCETYNRLIKRTIKTNLDLTKMESGYIGSINLKYVDNDLKFFKRRERLLKYCSDRKMPVILGSNMNFAVDRNYEQIRLSYFNNLEDLETAIKILSSFPY